MKSEWHSILFIDSYLLVECANGKDSLYSTKDHIESDSISV